MTDPEHPIPKSGEPALTSEPLRTEDFYMEGPYLVFTAAYHLRRGFCCNSDCRHCPYKETLSTDEPA
jgi:Family of unknown function (DUF5522)